MQRHRRVTCRADNGPARSLHVTGRLSPPAVAERNGPSLGGVQSVGPAPCAGPTFLVCRGRRDACTHGQTDRCICWSSLMAPLRAMLDVLHLRDSGAPASRLAWGEYWLERLAHPRHCLRSDRCLLHRHTCQLQDPSHWQRWRIAPNQGCATPHAHCRPDTRCLAVIWSGRRPMQHQHVFCRCCCAATHAASAILRMRRARTAVARRSSTCTELSQPMQPSVMLWP